MLTIGLFGAKTSWEYAKYGNLDVVCLFKDPKCQNLYWWYDFDDVGVDYMVFWGAYSSDEVFRMIKDKDYGILSN